MPIHINNDRDRLISDIKFQKYLPENPNPEFLNDSSSFAFNPCDVLTDSIYFPGGGLDFKQISIYGKFAHSFVYSDYSIEKQDLIDNLSAFVDYSPIHIEELNENKISPHSSKVKIRPQSSDFWNTRIFNNQIEIEKEIESHARAYPFIIWVIFEKQNKSYGPDRFSLLYIGGEGVATYASIYNSNYLTPRAVILSGTDQGFGGNWTCFEKRGGIFERVVMANPAGIPRYLFTWDRYELPKKFEIVRPFAMYWAKYIEKIEPPRSYPRPIFELDIWSTERLNFEWQKR